jgi:hypothetical protein
MKSCESYQNVIEGGARIVHEYLQVKDGQFKVIADLETANITDVSETLRKFYTEIRKTDRVVCPISIQKRTN